jgi:hypothetical protein
VAAVPQRIGLRHGDALKLSRSAVPLDWRSAEKPPRLSLAPHRAGKIVSMTTLGEGEPALGPWRVTPLASFVELVREQIGAPVAGTPVLAIDGRSSSGKSSLARRLQ